MPQASRESLNDLVRVRDRVRKAERNGRGGLSPSGGNAPNVQVGVELLGRLIAAFDAMPRIHDHIGNGNMEAALEIASQHVSEEAIY